MSNQDLHRHDKGTIVAGRAKGGKFAEKRRAEADARALSGFTEKDEQDIAGVYHLARRTVNANWINHTQVLNSREDIRQDAVIDLMDIVKTKNAQDAEAGLEPVPFTQRHGGMVRSIMSSKVQAVFNQGGRHEGGAGRKKLRQWKEAMETDLGRELSPKEFEDLAEGIRLDDFAPGRRPPIGYQHNSPVETSNHLIFTAEDDELLDQYADRIGRTDADPFTDVPSEPKDAHSVVYDSAMERASLPVNSDGRIVSADAQLIIWDTFREAGSGVPAITPIGSSAASRVSAVMGKFPGSAHGVAKRFLDGESTPKEDEALFAPFGGWSQLSEEQRDAVAGKVAGGPSERGTKLWRAALKSSVAKSA